MGNSVAAVVVIENVMLPENVKEVTLFLAPGLYVTDNK
mgnify:CR=1 FL=1